MGQRVKISEISSIEDLKRYGDETEFVFDGHEKPMKTPTGYNVETAHKDTSKQ